MVVYFTIRKGKVLYIYPAYSAINYCTKRNMADITEKINILKAQKNAVIMAHYYCSPEVQAIADHVGDSFYLAKKAKDSEADIIVFAGVKFMGESAKILNPGKKVLMPDITADCPMAHMASAQKIEEVRRIYPDVAVVCYINSTAELKCMSDVCVTSANAKKIVETLPNNDIFFIPDKNLAMHIAKTVKGKNFIYNDGYCPIHNDFSEAELLECMQKHPNAEVCSHPESREDILKHSDYIGSTSGIIKHAEESLKSEFIICTEKGIDYELKKNCPDKSFYYVGSSCICRDMKRNTLETVLRALETEENEILVNEDIRLAAEKPLNRMLELAK